MFDVKTYEAVRRIIDEVANKYSVTPENILALGRWQPLATARKEAIKRCREELKLSLPVLGYYFHRDHTTILAALS